MLLFFQMCFKRILKCHKILAKCFGRTSRHSIYSQSCFVEKQIIFVLRVKKIKFGVAKGFSLDIFLSFLRKPQKMLVLCETWRACIEYEDVHVKFLFEFF